MQEPPRHLVQELARRRAIIVLGAGASAGSISANGKHPPGWEKLLFDASELLHGDVASKTQAVDFVQRHQYLEAAEVIVRRAPAAEFDQFLRDQFSTPNYAAGPVHRATRDIDAKIVVTTNYDEIYDRLCRMGDATAGYSILKHYDPSIIEALRSEQRVIIKAHGCITDPQRIILSRSQYAKARRDFPEFFKTLDAAFLLNTVLFIGCSLDDPDLQLLLQNAALTTPKSRPHYALLSAATPEPIQESFQEGYNIQPWLYEASPDHAEAANALNLLFEEVEGERQRRPD